MDPLGPTTQDPDSAAPDSESPIRPNRTKSAVLAALGTGIFLLLAILLLQANGDKRELQDMLDSSNGEVDQLTSDLDAATSQLTDANADLDTAAGVRESIVDFIAVSLSLGGGISDRDGRCVAEAMDTQLGTEALLRSSLAAAGLTPNPEAGSQFTAGLADAAAECGVPLNSANAAPAISGTALPLFESSDNDRAVGAMAPTVTGFDFEGTEIQISGTGRPTAIVFLAHWCPHCQREVPRFQNWLDTTGGVLGVDVVSVATSNNPDRANYPASAWLEREGWTPAVLVDDSASSVFVAFGGGGFPYWVFLNADGSVAARVTGETDIPTLETLIRSIAP